MIFSIVWTPEGPFRPLRFCLFFFSFKFAFLEVNPVNTEIRMQIRVKKKQSKNEAAQMGREAFKGLKISGVIIRRYY